MPSNINVFQWFVVSPRSYMWPSPYKYHADKSRQVGHDRPMYAPRNQRKSWENVTFWQKMKFLWWVWSTCRDLSCIVLVWRGSYMVVGTPETIEARLYYLQWVYKCVRTHPGPHGSVHGPHSGAPGRMSKCRYKIIGSVYGPPDLLNGRFA